MDIDNKIKSFNKDKLIINLFNVRDQRVFCRFRILIIH